ncbi:MAG: tetratricopeptide repeat protein [Gammaproteobacteria bacterium]|nr:tetratricopeptide repeat protein [Gammaproteobacteria bacterium]
MSIKTDISYWTKIKVYARAVMIISVTVSLWSCISAPVVPVKKAVVQVPLQEATDENPKKLNVTPECPDVVPTATAAVPGQVPGVDVNGNKTNGTTAPGVNVATPPTDTNVRPNPTVSTQRHLDQASAANQNPATGAGKNNVSDQAVGQECVPKGIIQIAENLSVDAAVKRQFETATSLLQQEKYQEAIVLIEGLLTKLNGFTAPYINLGIAYAKLGEMEKALESFEQALKLNDIHPVANNELAIVYRQLGKYAEARKVYEKLLENFPGFWPANRNLGVLCDIYLNDLACALENYEIYASAKPEDDKMKIWIADVKSRM